MGFKPAFHTDLGEFFVKNFNPMWVIDEDNYHFLAVNQASIDKYGYTEIEFLKMKEIDLMKTENKKGTVIKKSRKATCMKTNL